MDESKTRKVFGMSEVTNWRTIDIGRLPVATIQRWMEHPEEMTVAEFTALQDYFARHPDTAARWGLPPLPAPERPEQGA